MQIVGLLVVLASASAVSAARHPVCAEYGLNWAAEIRCLRNLLSKCQLHGNMLYPQDSMSNFKHKAAMYYELPEYSKIRDHMAGMEKYVPMTTTARPTTTTTTTTAPVPSPTVPIDIEEIRSLLSKEAAQKIRDLESRVDIELRAMEERFNNNVETIRWEAQKEIRKINKTVRFMTKRIYRFGRAEYIYVDEKESWYGAEEQCQKWGGHLPSISDAAENRFIRDMHKWFAWIGMNDIQRENQYVWSDKSSLRYKNWKRGQPDNADFNENCAEMGPDGTWLDSFCMGGRHYICKRT